MHIPDGFLSPEVAAGTAVVAAGAVGVGLRRASARLDDRVVPLLGVTGAFVFAAQMLNFPVAGGTSGHFLGAALATILLGPWLATLVLAVVLATQCFVFADGGISALGANVLCMGVCGALATGGLMLLARRVLPRRRGVLLAVAGAGAWLAVIAGASATALLLALSGTVPLGTVLPAMLSVHVVIGLGEAAITVAAVSALMATRPDLIGAWAAAAAARGPRDRPGGVTMRRALIAALVVAALAALAPFASGSPDGLERVAGDRGFADRARPAARCARRRLRRARASMTPRLANAAAGFAGTLVVFALGAGLVAVVRHRPRVA